MGKSTIRRWGVVSSKVTRLVSTAILTIALTLVAADAAGAKWGRLEGGQATRATVGATVAQIGPAFKGGPLVQYATVEIELDAVDVDPSIPACSTCKTDDVGWLVIRKSDPFDQRPVITFEGPINWITVSPGSAIVSAGEDLALLLIDGGSPGSRTIGPPGELGLAPTLDSVVVSDFSGVGPTLQGFVLRGSVKLHGD
jgi:hypothetical protein